MTPSLPLPPSPLLSYPSFAILLPVSCCHGPQTTLELPSILKIRGAACKITENHFKATFRSSIPRLSSNPRCFLLPYGSSPFTHKCLQPQVLSTSSLLPSFKVNYESRFSASQGHVKPLQVMPLKFYRLLESQADLGRYKTPCSASLTWGILRPAVCRDCS